MYTCILHLYGYLWCICVRVHRCHFAYLCMFYLFMSMLLHSHVCIYKFLQMLFIHLCVHISVWIHKCVSMPMCIYMHVFVPLCVIICVSMFLNIYVFVCLSVYVVYICIMSLYVCAHTHILMYLCMYVCVYCCLCVFVCMNVCALGVPHDQWPKVNTWCYFFFVRRNTLELENFIGIELTELVLSSLCTGLAYMTPQD